MTDEDLIKRLSKEKNELIDDNLKLIKLYLKSQEDKRQLETNIAEAIKLLLDNTADYTDGDFEGMRFQNDIVEILKRGKESE